MTENELLNSGAPCNSTAVCSRTSVGRAYHIIKLCLTMPQLSWYRNRCHPGAFRVGVCTCNDVGFGRRLHDRILFSRLPITIATAGYGVSTFTCILPLKTQTFSCFAGKYAYAQKYWIKHPANVPPGNEDVLHALKNFRSAGTPHKTESEAIWR